MDSIYDRTRTYLNEILLYLSNDTQMNLVPMLAKSKRREIFDINKNRIKYKSSNDNERLLSYEEEQSLTSSVDNITSRLHSEYALID